MRLFTTTLQSENVCLSTNNPLFVYRFTYSFIDLQNVLATIRTTSTSTSMTITRFVVPMVMITMRTTWRDRVAMLIISGSGIARLGRQSHFLKEFLDRSVQNRELLNVFDRHFLMTHRTLPIVHHNVCNMLTTAYDLAAARQNDGICNEVLLPITIKNLWRCDLEVFSLRTSNTRFRAKTTKQQ